MHLLAAALAASLALGAPPPEGEGRLLDEVVAVVRNPASAAPRIITLSRLEQEARVALVSRGAVAAAAGPLDRAALRAALRWLLDQTLLSDEVAKLRLDDLDRADVLAEVARFRQRFAAPAGYERFLARTELTEDELTAILARIARVQRYVQSRIGRGARVEEDEVDRWLAAHGAPAAPPAARDAARSELGDERAAAQVKELLADLAGRADVRVTGSLRAGPEEGR